jgi:hypothetical protein
MFCSKPTDVEWRFTEKGERVRVSVRTGRIIPLPNGAKELEDFINPLTYSGITLSNELRHRHFFVLLSVLNQAAKTSVKSCEF